MSIAVQEVSASRASAAVLAPVAPQIRSVFFEDLSIGLSETMSRVITSEDVLAFADVSGDHNPIHISEEFASKTFFKTRIAHGMLTASLISTMLGTRLPGQGVIYFSQTLNFRAPVKIGDRVEVTVEVAELMPEKCRARLACSCMVGDEVVLDGEAWVKVPSKYPPPPKA
jgi:3-hydroxybutyryl-CoA dehydratase